MDDNTTRNWFLKKHSAFVSCNFSNLNANHQCYCCPNCTLKFPHAFNYYPICALYCTPRMSVACDRHLLNYLSISSMVCQSFVSICRTVGVVEGVRRTVEPSARKLASFNVRFDLSLMIWPKMNINNGVSLYLLFLCPHLFLCVGGESGTIGLASTAIAAPK